MVWTLCSTCLILQLAALLPNFLGPGPRYQSSPVGQSQGTEKEQGESQASWWLPGLLGSHVPGQACYPVLPNTKGDGMEGVPPLSMASEKPAIFVNGFLMREMEILGEVN